MDTSDSTLGVVPPPSISYSSRRYVPSQEVRENVFYQHDTPVQALREKDQSKLRSSQILTSLHQVVSELVQNALDAHALHIDVGVDPVQWTCWVRDDGIGMGRDFMKTLGTGMAGRYRTSKTYTPILLSESNSFGFRGEALASAAELCCLEISSRDASARESWSVIVKGGEQLYYGPAVRWRREKPGTVVYVREAFFNLPVRRISHPSGQRTLELVRKEIERLALVSPQTVFTLDKEDCGRQVRVMTILKSASALAAFHNVFGRSLAENVDEINFSRGTMKVEGFISSQGASSKGYQFLYVNRFFLEPCEWHRMIETWFSNSTFAKQGKEMGCEYNPRQAVHSPRKLECRPVYCLNLHIPRDDVDVYLEPSKRTMQFQDRHAVEEILSHAVRAFLERNGFELPKPCSSARQPDGEECPSPTPRKRFKPEIGPEMELPNRMRGANHLSPRVSAELHALPDHPGSHPVVWTDPNTGEAFLVDIRTGTSFPVGETVIRNSHDHQRRSGQSTYVDRSRLKRKEASIASEGCPESSPAWIHTTLESCRTAVYEQGECPVPATVSKTWATSASALPRTFKTMFEDGHGDCDTKQKFTREDLRRIEVLFQVDRKFIACAVQAQDGIRTLILIDQHAASERVRVERFLVELASDFLGHHPSSPVEGVRRKTLSQPTPVLLTLDEIRVCTTAAFQRLISRWGFGVTIDQSPSSSVDRIGQLWVSTIPELLSARLSKLGELETIVKAFVVMVQTNPSDDFYLEESVGEEANAGATWLKALKWCPSQLSELVNSKACRGAIMFNDLLSIEQCQSLISNLADTDFPYQCAHGRPSLVPLTALKRTDEAIRHLRPLDWRNLRRNTPT